MVDEDTLDIVRACLKHDNVHEPGPRDKVYKTECMFSFDTPLSPGGLYLNLSTWQSYGEHVVHLDQERTGNKLYMHEKAVKVPLQADEEPGDLENFSLVGDSGFKLGGDKHELEKAQWLVVLPEGIRISLPAPELPDLILNTLAKISLHDSVKLQDETTAWQEELKESKYAANLPQLEMGLGRFGRSIPSNAELWQCDETGVRDNLWLNLSTGFIGSGRANWDGTGGNGAAERHYDASGQQYPLAVKLGTITPHAADVFSYAEDEMVTDPKLAEHLQHWGINMMAMQKTEKTITELQIDLNMSYEFDKITESGSTLQPLKGPGHVGLKNLGNSCYMNSVLQLLWTVPQVQERYASKADVIFRSAPQDPAGDFPTQMAKLGVALCYARTGEPCVPEQEPKENGEESLDVAQNHIVTPSVHPLSFKSLVGKGHPEFSTSRQQDASEFYQHLLDIMTRAERAFGERMGSAGEGATANAFEFSIETRVQCSESRRVSYKQDAPTNLLSLNIPMQAAANKEDVEEYQERESRRLSLRESNADAYIHQDGGSGGPKAISSSNEEPKVLPRVPLSACLHRWTADEEVGDYFSAILGCKTKATKHQRMTNFPPFLVLQLNRYYMASDWTCKKLEVLVDVPEKLNLEPLRGKGLQADEIAQPEDPRSISHPFVSGSRDGEAEKAVVPDQETIEALVQMGFSENGSRRAVIATKNGGTEVSMEWVLQHMDDPDFNNPLQDVASTASPSSGFQADSEAVAMLSTMGFTERQAIAALKACSGSLERAADWLFSHAADLDQSVAEILDIPVAAKGILPCTGKKSKEDLLDGRGEYRLTGFISHMGANTACGHYVCHLLKEGRWVIYNDEKVAVSEMPPKELGYLYLFQRTDAF